MAFVNLFKAPKPSTAGVPALQPQTPAFQPPTEAPPKAAPNPFDNGGGYGAPSGGNTIQDSLLGILQGKHIQPNDPAFGSILQNVSANYGLQPGQNGYAQYYPNNNTVGLSGGYLANVNGNWNYQPRGPETGGGNAFSDPATSGWEELVRQLTGKLMGYYDQLQGPAYTPDQMQLFQTQALDPLTQQRDALNQQTMQHFASRGIDPNSGIAQQALLDNNRGYEQQRTKTQADLATNAINVQKTQQQQAVQVGLDAANLMQGIPNMANTRLTLANQTLGSGGGFSNASQLIQQLMQAQQTGQMNSQQFWAALGQLLGGL